MTQSKIAAERALEIWQHMQDELVRVVGLLSDTQMNMRIAPNLRTLGEQAEHIVRGRALWVHKVVDDPSLEPMMNWDEPDDPTRSVAEVVVGLQHTWQILRAYIEPSTTDDPGLGVGAGEGRPAHRLGDARPRPVPCWGACPHAGRSWP